MVVLRWNQGYTYTGYQSDDSITGTKASLPKGEVLGALTWRVGQLHGVLEVDWRQNRHIQGHTCESLSIRKLLAGRAGHIDLPDQLCSSRSKTLSSFAWQSRKEPHVRYSMSIAVIEHMMLVPSMQKSHCVITPLRLCMSSSAGAAPVYKQGVTAQTGFRSGKGSMAKLTGRMAEPSCRSSARI